MVKLADDMQHEHLRKHVKQRLNEVQHFVQNEEVIDDDLEATFEATAISCAKAAGRMVNAFEHTPRLSEETAKTIKMLTEAAAQLINCLGNRI